MLDAIKKDEDLSKMFINKEQALRMYTPETLIVVVDTHRPSFSNCPQELLSGTGRVVVIDHHRRGEEFVANPVLVYLEPYASSTCELVTELLQYLKDDMKLKEIEATALMAGIIMDTKNFAFKTGIRTFEAASYLRSQGADPTFIHRLFQEDMESIVNRTEVVKQAEILYDNIAVSVFREKTKNPSLIAALGADALMNLKNITASFVLCPGEDGIVISGRSLGDINVQVVLEKLGGGGHLTVAGAQLPGATMEEALSELKRALKEYIEGSDEK
jgi:c-di-AMP phosphodiesterase-like protein